MPSASTALRWVGLFAVYTVLALFVLYPAWVTLEHGVVGDWTHPDMISNHWLYRWLADELLTGGSILHNGRYYFPVGDAPWLAGNGSDAVPYTPLSLLLEWPGSVTLWIVLMVALNGLSGAVLARTAGAGWLGSTFGGALLVFSPYVSYELSCARLAQAPLYWFAFFMAAWLALLRKPSLARAALAGALYGATAFTYWYMGLWAALAGGLVWLVHRNLRALAMFVPFALLTTVPPLVVFLQNWADIPGTAESTFPHSITISMGLPFSFPLFASGSDLQTITLPLLGVGLAVYGLRQRSRVPEWLGLLVGAAVFYGLALGPELLLPSGESTGVPGPFLAVYGASETLQRFWWPYRHIAPLTVLLVPFAALGAGALARTLDAQAPWAAVAMIVFLPMELAGRDASVPVVASWWEEPETYAQLDGLPDGHLVELPLASAIARTQQSLSYQWIHGRTLVNGHAMWVDRVRPQAWDAWLAEQPLLAMLWGVEKGEVSGQVDVTDAALDLDGLLAEGVRYVSLNPEFFPGELDDLHGRHRAFLVAVFGEPVVSGPASSVEGDTGLIEIWDVSATTGQVQAWRWVEYSPPSAYVQSDGRTALPRGITSAGWRSFPRSFPPDMPPDVELTQATEQAERAIEEGFPPMLRRRLERDRDRAAAAAEARKAAGAGQAVPVDAPDPAAPDPTAPGDGEAAPAGEDRATDDGGTP